MSRSISKLAERTDPLVNRVAGMIRRMAIQTTARALWQLVGYRNPDGTNETMPVEQFGGIGFYARPPASGKPEAIVVMVGGPTSPAIVATRDEATRAAMVGNLESDETAVYSSKAVVLIKADGTIEIRSKTGVAVPLATKEDVEALKEWCRLHEHSALSAPSPTATAMPPVTGTSKLRGE